MKYLVPGHYTIGLKIVLKGNGAFGNPPPVTGTLVVEPTPPTASFEVFPSSNLGEALRLGQEIKPEEAVTFNGGDSIDPTGSPTGTATHKLKHYTWKFGDGATEVTTTPEYTRSFANPGTEAHAESVSLTVTNEEGIESVTAATQMLTIGGTAPAKEPVKEPVKEVVKEPVKEAPPPAKTVILPPAKKPLTTAQKLAKALKTCKKDKSKRARSVCEKAARKRYAPKPKPKKKRKK